MLKARKKLSEPEVRYFLRQLIHGCRYVHSKKIVHRDLKLGNMLLDEQMQLKVDNNGSESILLFILIIICVYSVI